MTDRTVEDKPTPQGTDWASVRRWCMLGAAAMATAVLAMALADGRSRDWSSDDGAGAMALVVTAPTSPPSFLQSTAWTLPSEATRLAANDDGAPTLELETSSAHVIVGLENGQGLIALGIWPGIVGPTPAEILVSPASSALAVVGLHPDLAGGDLGGHRARLAIAMASPAFDELVDEIERSNGIDSWNDAHRDLMRDVIGYVVAQTALVPLCAGAEVLDATVHRCPDGTLQNSAGRTVVLVDPGGLRCAVAPAARHSLDDAGLTTIVDLVAMATLPAQGWSPSVEAVPGEIHDHQCGEGSRADSPPSAGVALWEDATILAQSVGASTAPPIAEDVDRIAELVERLQGSDDTPAAARRVGVAAQLIADPRAGELLNLVPLTADSVAQLTRLAGLLARMYS